MPIAILWGFLILIPFSADAFVAEVLARSSAKLFNESCDASKAKKTDSENCAADSRAMARPDSQAPMQDLEMSVYFSQLAELRRADHVCADQMIAGVQGQTFTVYAKDMESKVSDISSLMIDLLRSQTRIATLDLQRKSFKGQADADKIEHQIEKERENIKKLLAGIATIESSIPLSGQEAVKEFLNSQVIAQTEDSVSMAGLGSSQKIPPKKIDSQKFQNDLSAALKKAQTNLKNDIQILDTGIASQGDDLSRTTRESLAQDHDLVEKYRSQHPELKDQAQRLLCEADATYGSGAQKRDQALMVGSIGLGVLSGGIGLAVRGAVIETASVAFASTRLSLARGLISSTSARVLGSLSMAVNLQNGAQVIDKACGDQFTESVKTKGPACEQVSMQTLERDNCIAASGLASFGVVASGIGLWAKGVKFSPALAKVDTTPIPESFLRLKKAIDGTKSKYFYRHTLERTADGKVVLNIANLVGEEKSFAKVIVPAIKAGEIDHIDAGIITGPKVLRLLTGLPKISPETKSMKVTGSLTPKDVLRDIESQRNLSKLSKRPKGKDTHDYISAKDMDEFNSSLKKLGLEKACWQFYRSWLDKCGELEFTLDSKNPENVIWSKPD